MNDVVQCKEIDKGVSNAWRWEWLEGEVDGCERLGDFMWKVNLAGCAYCTACNKDVDYRNGGKKVLVQHCTALFDVDCID